MDVALSTDGSQPVRPFRALSIDGGGMRGIYTAAYLAGIASAFAQRRGVPALDIGGGCDLLVGTSTGAIIASALAVPIAPARIVELYRQHGGRIFRRRIPALWGLVPDLFLRRKALEDGDRALSEALTGVFREVTIGEIWRERQIALCVPALEMSQHRAWVFKTPHLRTSFGRDNNARLADVCLATTAAPLYRSLARLRPPSTASTTYFADGGLWANNPVLVALTESIQMLATQPKRPLEIFSLGTCPRPEGTFLDGDARHFGLQEWRFGSRIATLSIDAQESAFDYMARLITPHLDRPCSLVRFPRGPVPAELQPYLDLDETSERGLNRLVAQATADVNATMSACGRADDPSGRAICRLFEDVPVLKDVPVMEAR